MLTCQCLTGCAHPSCSPLTQHIHGFRGRFRSAPARGETDPKLDWELKIFVTRRDLGLTGRKTSFSSFDSDLSLQADLSQVRCPSWHLVKNHCYSPRISQNNQAGGKRHRRILGPEFQIWIHFRETYLNHCSHNQSTGKQRGHLGHRESQEKHQP